MKKYMYNVYFEGTKGPVQLLGSVRTKEFGLAIIDEFLREKKYHSYYKRLWNDKMYDGRKWTDATKIDVGSHCEFFYIKPPVEIGSGEQI